MSYLSELKNELRKAGKLERTTRMTVDMLEAAWIKDNPECAKCPNTYNLSYDHIIPQSILSNFNIDSGHEFWEENSQTLCYACNQRKGNTLDLNNIKTKPLLLQLLGEHSPSGVTQWAEYGKKQGYWDYYLEQTL